MGYTNSPLAKYTKLSPNNSGKRTHAIDRITPHCVVGQLSAQTIGTCFKDASSKASCNYGIGTEGDVILVVDESMRSWCSSSNANDQRAVTIECASDKTTPYAFNDKVYNTLIDLCVDICQRNGKKKLLWFGDKNKALSYNPKADEMVLTVHRWFKNKECPGDWLYARLGDLVDKVNAKLGSGTSFSQPQSQPAESTKEYPQVPFAVKVLVNDLNYRESPSINAETLGQIKKGTYTITQVQNGWGKLKSGIGWIYLENPSYCTVCGNTNSGAPQSQTPAFQVKVVADNLNIRKGPGINYDVCGSITNRGTYTIVEEQNGFGKLKSNAGWISLQYTKRL